MKSLKSILIITTLLLGLMGAVYALNPGDTKSDNKEHCKKAEKSCKHEGGDACAKKDKAGDKSKKEMKKACKEGCKKACCTDKKG